MWEKIDKTEKTILLVASLVSASHLLLIAFAAIFLEISVPTCQPNEKLFDHSSLQSVGYRRYEVHYVAKMWNFEPKKLVLPVGATVDFFLASKDVNHGFNIDGTNVNLMAVPGVVNREVQTFRAPGIYHVVCHEYCGYGHQNMNAVIEVTDRVNEAQMDPVEPGSIAHELKEANPLAASGKKLYQLRGCVACHSLDGTPATGPSFKGLWGRIEEMQDGLKVKVDAAYIAESIKMPQAKIVKGYGPVMPLLGLTDDEINAVTEFIKTVK